MVEICSISKKKPVEFHPRSRFVLSTAAGLPTFYLKNGVGKRVYGEEGLTTMMGRRCQSTS